jgi:hypothetical protein
MRALLMMLSSTNCLTCAMARAATSSSYTELLAKVRLSAVRLQWRTKA